MQDAKKYCPEISLQHRITAQVEALKSEVGELSERQASDHKSVLGDVDGLKNGLNDKIDGNLAEVAKLVNDEAERLSAQAGKVEGEMKEELAAIRIGIQFSFK